MQHDFTHDKLSVCQKTPLLLYIVKGAFFMVFKNKLRKEALEFYKEMAKADNFDPRHIPALLVMATTYNQYLDATEALDDSGGAVYEVESQNGKLKKLNPWVKVQTDAQIQFLKLLQEFGLTPKAAKALKDTTDTTEHPLLKWLNKKAEEELDNDSKA